MIVIDILLWFSFNELMTLFPIYLRFVELKITSNLVEMIITLSSSRYITHHKEQLNSIMFKTTTDAIRRFALKVEDYAAYI